MARSKIMDPRAALLAAITEKEVMRACLDVLALARFPAFRQNTGAMKDPRGQLVKFAFRGCSDILAIVPGSGRWLAVETKRPVKPSPLTEDQLAFLETIRGHGGVAICVDNADRLASVCAKLTVHPLARFDLRGNPL